MEFSLLKGWRELDEDPMPWEEGMDLNEHLKRYGYYSFGDRLGADGLGWSAVMYATDFKSEVKAPYPYVVDIGNSYESKFVFCVDYLSGVEVMSRYALLVVADLLSGMIDDLESRLETERKESTALRERRWHDHRAARELLVNRTKPTSQL